LNTKNGDLESKNPTFTDELFAQCKESRDFRPILFEWYKFVGILCNKISCLSPESQACKQIQSVHYAVLIGLLNRCSRLMLSNTRLSSTRKYGETTRILDRSISESAIIIQWLCHRDNTECFFRYLADGLKKDLILKEQIESNIQDRSGNILIIEQRMLASIQNCINLSGLSEKDVRNAKKFPDFAQICKDLEYKNEVYIAIQRMGSHAVHGTWSELITNYLEHKDDHKFYPRDHEIETQDGQYIIIIRLILGAMESFLRYVIYDNTERSEIISTIREVEEKIIEIQNLAWASDFNANN